MFFVENLIFFVRGFVGCLLPQADEKVIQAVLDVPRRDTEPEPTSENRVLLPLPKHHSKTAVKTKKRTTVRLFCRPGI